jgi:c-di-GMP-binding flagellar brake protein YcgR
VSETKEVVKTAPFEPAKPEETVPLLQSAVLRKSKLQCWSSGQAHSYTSRIVKVNESSGLKSISVSKEFPGGDEFEGALVREAQEEIHFSLHLPTDIIFFKGELRRGESGTFTARVKEPIYKVQRRRSLRLPIPAVAAVAVKFRLASDAAKSYQAQLLNLSEGGLSIMSGVDGLFKLLQKDVKLAQIEFAIGGMEIAAAGIVRHSMEISTGSTVKDRFRFGIEFTALDPKLRDRLARYVLEESAKFLGRL